MGTSVIVLKPVTNPPVDNTLLELTLRATDATSENIILYPRPLEALAGLALITLVAMGISDSWPTVNQVTGGVEWYQDGVKYIGAAGAGSAVFPIEPEVKIGTVYGPSGNDYTGTYNPTASAVYPLTSDVDLGITYGPNGADFTGNVIQPVPADVANGIQYGAAGTEFTGTLVIPPVPSGYRYDTNSGELVKILSNSLVASFQS